MKRILLVLLFVGVFLPFVSASPSVGGSIPGIDMDFNDTSSRSLEQYFFNSTSSNLSVVFDHPVLSDTVVNLSRNQTFVSDVMSIVISPSGVFAVSSNSEAISYYSPVTVSFCDGNCSSQVFDLVIGSPDNTLFAPIDLSSLPIVVLLLAISFGALVLGKINYGIPLFWFFVLTLVLVASSVHFLFVLVSLFAAVLSLYNVKN